MARRLVFTYLATLHVIVSCSASVAATPLVMAELEAKRMMAQADSDRASAAQELDAWKLTQLKELHSNGHASWQEVAEQEVAVRSATASANAAEQYVQALLHWQARVVKWNPPQTLAASESVRLYMPRSARLVAWMSTNVASFELSKRHLENLRREHQSAADIDVSSLETAMKAAEQAVEVYGRSESDAHLLKRAEIKLRLATAEFESAKARQAAASIVARRMALVRASLRAKQPEDQMDEDQASPALARVGTRFVDATSDRELTGLVKAMAADETTSSTHVEWLEQQRDAALSRIDGLQKLSAHADAVRGELDQAKQQHRDLESQIRQAQQIVRMRQRIADGYERSLDSPPTSIVVDDAVQMDASTVRHSLELQRLKLRAEASRAAIEAQRDYLVERMKRLESIPEGARSPQELDHLRHKVKGIQLQLAMAGSELVALDREQERFSRQVQSQRGRQYQLVQAGKGEFIRRGQVAMAEALFGAVGFIGESGLFLQQPNTYPYIESTMLLERMSELRVERPGLTAGLFSRVGWRFGGTFPRRGVDSSLWSALNAGGGLQMATDWFTYPGGLFCYTPYALRRMSSRYRWTSCNHLSSTSRYRFRSCYPYAGYAFGSRGESMSSYWIGCPIGNSFPYRSSCYYQTAFPTGSNRYTNPYPRPSRLYSGRGSSAWRNASCID